MWREQQGESERMKSLKREELAVPGDKRTLFSPTAKNLDFWDSVNNGAYHTFLAVNYIRECVLTCPMRALVTCGRSGRRNSAKFCPDIIS